MISYSELSQLNDGTQGSITSIVMGSATIVVPAISFNVSVIIRLFTPLSGSPTAGVLTFILLVPSYDNSDVNTLKFTVYTVQVHVGV